MSTFKTFYAFNIGSLKAMHYSYLKSLPRWATIKLCAVGSKETQFVWITASFILFLVDVFAAQEHLIRKYTRQTHRSSKCNILTELDFMINKQLILLSHVRKRHSVAVKLQWLHVWFTPTTVNKKSGQLTISDRCALVQGHSRSSTFVAIESPYTTSY